MKMTARADQPALQRTLAKLLLSGQLRNTVLTLALVIASLVIIKNLEWPYVWTGLLWSCVLFVLTWQGARPFGRAVWFNLGFAVFTLTGLEVYLAIQTDGLKSVNVSGTLDSWYRRIARELGKSREDLRQEGSITQGFTEPHAVLGYGLRRGKRVTARHYMGDELIFDVVYTTNDEGLRKGPPAADARRSIVFFGGSFTFGHGVEDEQTLPYRVGMLKQGNLRVYNFGYCGYGPHQMLAALEAGIVDSTVKEPPVCAVYQALPCHVERVAGLTSWDEHGPRYVLDGQGHVIRQGRFSDELTPRTRKLASYLRRSYLIDRAFARIETKGIGYAGIDLFAAVVDRARQQFEQRYPGSEFHVLLWDERHQSKAARIRRQLAARDIRLHLISDIILDIDQHPERYRLSPHDGHPNSKTYDRLSQYVSDAILR